MPEFMGKTVRLANRLAAIASGLILAALIGVSGLQVFYRYVLLQPLVWSEEAARHLLIWLSFIAAGIALREGMHPRVAVIEQMLPPRAQRGVRWVLVAGIAVFLVVFVAITWNVAMRYHGYNSLGTGLPQSLPRLALPVGGVLLLINVLSLLTPPETDYEIRRFGTEADDAPAVSKVTP